MKMSIKKGIVVAPVLLIFIIGFSLSQSVYAEELTVSINKTFYDEGEEINILGTADPNLVEEIFLAGITEPKLIHLPVTIQVFNSGRDLIIVAQIYIEQDERFSHTIITGGSLWQDPGLYTIRVMQGKNIVEIQFWFKFNGGLVSDLKSQLAREPSGNIFFTNPEIVDSFGNPLTRIPVGERVVFSAVIDNDQSTVLVIAFGGVITNSEGILKKVDWITNSLNPNQSLSPTLSWIPDTSGNYMISLELWNNPSERDLLAQSLTLELEVFDGLQNGNSLTNPLFLTLGDEGDPFLTPLEESQLEAVNLKLQIQTLEAQILDLQNQIDNLNQIIMEQINVIYTWILAR